MQILQQMSLLATPTNYVRPLIECPMLAYQTSTLVVKWLACMQQAWLLQLARKYVARENTTAIFSRRTRIWKFG